MVADPRVSPTPRSLCTVVCKWTYSPLNGWDDSFWATVGLEDLMENNHAKIGKACLKKKKKKNVRKNDPHLGLQFGMTKKEQVRKR